MHWGAPAYQPLPRNHCVPTEMVRPADREGVVYSSWVFDGDKTMRVLAVPIALSLSTSVPALAASPQIEAAVKVFQSVGSDARRLQIFCA